MNDELRDFDLKSRERQTVSEGGGSSTPRWPWWLAVGLAIVALTAFLWFRARGAEEVPVVPPEPAVTQAPEPEERAPALDLGEVPPLNDSDAWLQGVVAQISSHPQLAEWLVTPELIRGFVVVVDNIAEGVTPRKHMQMAAPEAKFSIDERDGKLFVDPASYERFDLLVDVIESLDTEGTAELYRAIRPLCRQAYEDLGYTGSDFDAVLAQAVEKLLQVPVVTQPIELEKKVAVYRFADPDLESLSPAAKQFLRLGPDNLQRLQRKVRELAREIGLAGVS